MSTKKTSLSTGTLNLKFMQRARTSGSEPVPSLEKKKIVDEGEWDIGSEARKIWGLTAGSDLKSTSAHIVYEPSYIPFLSTKSIKGRSLFKDGSAASVDERTLEPETHDDSSPGEITRPRSGPSKLPLPISRRRQPPDSLSAKTEPPNTVSSPPPRTFLRPAGIDTPSQRSSFKQNKRKAAGDAEGMLAGTPIDFDTKDTTALISSSTPGSTPSSQLQVSRKKNKP